MSEPDFRPAVAEMPPETLSDLRDWMRVSGCSTQTYHVGEHTGDDGFVLMETENGFTWSFSERGQVQVLETFQSETAAVATLATIQEPLRRLQARVAHLDPLAQLLYVDAFSGLADQLLMKVDKMGMAASLEARCPLLDQEFVEYAAKLPTDFKLGPDGGKRVFRRSLDGLIPRAILDRPKQGFDVPLGDWLQKDLRWLVERLLLEGDAPLGHHARPR